jgi:2-polyprenyl-3-methyl-5-hydroxy-6-metoxy-1,4-benzoquinol methylase
MPRPVRRVLVWAYNRWLAFKSSRERSVKNIARSNSRQAFETIYGAPDLLEEYLSPDRLAFYEEVADRCAAFEPRRVIDVGCGPGHLLAAILSRLPDVELAVGVDYAQAAIDRLHEVEPRARGIVAELPDLDLAGDLFDVVLCTEVLEHLDRPDEALRALGSLRAAGGRIVVTVPDGEHDHWEAHVNFWNAAELEAFLSAAGPTTVSRLHGGDLLAVVHAS